jgi:hypothetical protein
MDPDANLAEQLRLALLIQQDMDAGACDVDGERAGRLADLVLALNEWLARGGALPGAWKR